MGNYSEKQISIDSQSLYEFSNSDYKNSIGLWDKTVKPSSLFENPAVKARSLFESPTQFTTLTKNILPSTKINEPLQTIPKGVPSTVPQYPVQTEKTIQAILAVKSGFPIWGYFAIAGGILLIGGIIAIIVIKSKK